VKKIFLAMLDSQKHMIDQLCEIIDDREMFLAKYNLMEEELKDLLWVVHSVSQDELNYHMQKY